MSKILVPTSNNLTTGLVQNTPQIVREKYLNPDPAGKENDLLNLEEIECAINQPSQKGDSFPSFSENEEANKDAIKRGREAAKISEVPEDFNKKPASAPEASQVKSFFNIFTAFVAVVLLYQLHKKGERYREERTNERNQEEERENFSVIHREISRNLGYLTQALREKLENQTLSGNKDFLQALNACLQCENEEDLQGRLAHFTDHQDILRNFGRIKLEVGRLRSAVLDSYIGREFGLLIREDQLNIDALNIIQNNLSMHESEETKQLINNALILILGLQQTLPTGFSADLFTNESIPVAIPEDDATNTIPAAEVSQPTNEGTPVATPEDDATNTIPATEVAQPVLVTVTTERGRIV